MAESSRCYKYGGRDETVPRHECRSDWCEFDYPELITDDLLLWADLGLTNEIDLCNRKLKFSQERAQSA